MHATLCKLEEVAFGGMAAVSSVHFEPFQDQMNGVPY